MTGLGPIETFAIAVGVPLGLAFLTFWIWMLVDCLKHESRAGHDRLVWALVIIFAELLGALIYYFLRYRRRAEPVPEPSAAG